MRELLFEHPLMIVVGGIALAGLAIFLWVQTAKKEMLYGGIVLLVLTALLAAVSLQVVTDRERIIQILDEVAVALENNDYETVYAAIHPNSQEGVQRAKAELPNYTFKEARVTRVREISVNRDSTPPTAIAIFTVVVDVAANGQSYRVPRLVKIYFRERDGRWLVHDYEHTHPTGQGFDA